MYFHIIIYLSKFVELPVQVTDMSSGRRGRVRASTSTDNGRSQKVSEAVNPLPPQVSFAALCKDFKNLGGQPFKGLESIIEVQDWLRSCERIFKSMKLIDEREREMASWQLQESAAAWWNAVVANISED